MQYSSRAEAKQGYIFGNRNFGDKAMVREQSTRARSRATGSFLRSTPGSQSLERGMLLLRTFRLGLDTLSNAELSSRTGLPRPTVSRLTRSLVDAGFLAYDHEKQGYRLASVCLSLGLAYRSTLRAVDAALPLMRTLAERRRVNVGLATADQLEMVYLDSVRLSRLSLFRRIVPGSRIPITKTALGGAFMAGLSADERGALWTRLRQANGLDWTAQRRGIDAALRSVRERGFCIAEWQVGMKSVAAPIRAPSGELYALNVSFPVPAVSAEEQAQDHAALLLRLVADIRTCWDRLAGG